MHERSATGRFGEDMAARYLENDGYVIVGRQVHIGGAELDLVAQKGGEVVFVEVKTRHGAGFGAPEESVTSVKRNHLRRAVYAYLARMPRRPASFRIDVIAIVLPETGRTARLKHYRNAVGEDG